MRKFKIIQCLKYMFLAILAAHFLSSLLWFMPRIMPVVFVLGADLRKYRIAQRNETLSLWYEQATRSWIQSIFACVGIISFQKMMISFHRVSVLNDSAFRKHAFISIWCKNSKMNTLNDKEVTITILVQTTTWTGHQSSKHFVNSKMNTNLCQNVNHCQQRSGKLNKHTWI